MRGGGKYKPEAQARGFAETYSPACDLGLYPIQSGVGVLAELLQAGRPHHNFLQAGRPHHNKRLPQNHDWMTPLTAIITPSPCLPSPCLRENSLTFSLDSRGERRLAHRSFRTVWGLAASSSSWIWWHNESGSGICPRPPAARPLTMRPLTTTAGSENHWSIVRRPARQPGP